jgi:RNA polymerase sigma-54 factor
MSFLQLSTAELEGQLRQELDKNPALELVEELRCPQCGKRLQTHPCPRCAAPQDDGGPVVCLSQRPTFQFEARDDDDDFPRDLRAPDRLDEYILRQIGPALTPAERPIAAYILARLDEHGLLPETAGEIAAYTRAHLSDVERVLSLIQHADPPGVGACTPQESLLIQLECLAETASLAARPTIALARLIVEQHFDTLGHHDLTRIARQLHVSGSSVEAAAAFIQRNLTPYPALAFWGEGKLAQRNEATLRTPDVTISFLNRAENSGPLLVEVFTPLSGWLRVNPEFKAALAECEGGERERWSQAVMEAALVTKCLQQRNHTMRRLMGIIAAEQRAFILGGDGDLRPLTRASVARTLDVHESTISRAVAGKSAALPDGRIVPLSKFFDRSLSVRDRVRLLVEAETQPLTDDQISERLAQQGLQVARRTVAKYRKMLGILPANVRARRNQQRLTLHPAHLPSTDNAIIRKPQSAI